MLLVASTVNFSSGRYFSGGSKDVASRLPFDAGLEAVGIIAAVGDSVKHLKVGTPAAIMTFGSYAEFTKVHSKHILPVARPDLEVVALLTSGMTTSLALEKAAQMESGKTVLVTAGAGQMSSKTPLNALGRRPGEDSGMQIPRKAQFGVVKIDDDIYGEVKNFMFKILMAAGYTIELKMRESRNVSSIEDFIDSGMKEYIKRSRVTFETALADLIDNSSHAVWSNSHVNTRLIWCGAANTGSGNFSLLWHMYIVTWLINPKDNGVKQY